MIFGGNVLHQGIILSISSFLSFELSTLPLAHKTILCN